jgi:hypothetical protein
MLHSRGFLCSIPARIMQWIAEPCFDKIAFDPIQSIRLCLAVSRMREYTISEIKMQPVTYH